MARDCYECQEGVDNRSKDTRGLTCFLCNDAYHVKCTASKKDDAYKFLKENPDTGCKWFCDYCLKKASRYCGQLNVLLAQEEMLKPLKESIKSMEENLGKIKTEPKYEDKTFAGIVKQTIQEVKNDEKVDKININSKEKVIQKENVLIIKPKTNARNNDVKKSTEGVKEILKKCTVPITGYRESSKGDIIVKFPSSENKAKAERELSGEINGSPTLKISEPIRILPKMAIVNVPKALDDSTIMETIKNKNPEILNLINNGEEMSVVAHINSLKNSLYKTVIVKVSPYIRKHIISQGNYVYLELSRCKVYDNVWVRRCFHCQEYGHNASSCYKKDENPICGFCSLGHNSRECQNKQNLKCINCVRFGKGNLNHSVTDKCCPVISYHKELIVRDTDYSTSKN